MDKLSAYRILGLNSDASTEEVKEAYARLSKEYHPEENPEEFQCIHEAYTALTRRGRRVSHTTMTEPSSVKQTTSVEKKETDLVFHGIENAEEEVEYDEGYDFDESISQAESEEIKRLKTVIAQVDKELKLLFASSNYKNTNKFKEFFQKEEYQKVFYTREFVRSFTQCLGQVKLLPELYSYVIELYRLKAISDEYMDEDVQKLYQVIDRRYNVKKDAYLANRSVNKYAILAIVTYVVTLNGSRVAKLMEGMVFHSQHIVTCAIPYLLFAVLGIYLYKVLRRQHSTYFAQTIVAVVYMVLGVMQTFVFQCLIDYTEVLVSKLPLSLSIVFILASLDWVIITGITAFMQSLRKKK